LHHLRATIDNPKNAVLIVGYQAPHTLGRRIVERQREVKIFGALVPLRAEVKVLNGFSAHADQNDLLAFCKDTKEKGNLEQVVLVHGDPVPMRVLSDMLGDRGFSKVHSPDPGTRLNV
jgi:metallo-beta-lactamase family protein